MNELEPEDAPREVTGDTSPDGSTHAPRDLFEFLPHLVWVSDADGKLEYASPELVQYTREPLAKVLGDGWLDLVHPEDAAALRARWQESVRTGADYSVEIRMLRRDGQYRWFQIRARAVRDEAGNISNWVGANVDVHDAHEARAALEREQQRLARIVAAATGAFCGFELGPDGQVSCSYASAGVRDVFGLEPEAVLADANRFWQLIHPADVERVRAQALVSAATVTPWHSEYRVLHPLRGELWVESHALPSPEQGGGARFYAFIHEITDRKRMERSLRLRSEALANSLAAFGFVSREGKILYVNAAYLKMWGFEDVAEVVGTRPGTHCVDRKVPVRMTEIVEREGSCTAEFTARRKDGSTFETLMSIQKAVDEEGDKIYIATAIDITERKRAEQELRESRAQLMAALEASGTGTWVLHVRDNVLWMDDAALKLFGRTREEAGSGEVERVLSFIHRDDRLLVEQELERALQAGDETTMEFRVVHHDGTTHWLGIKGRAEHGLSGEPTLIRGAVIDVTEHKRAQESQRLEALGTLAGGIAHDFNNMLLAIVANTGLAVAELPREHPLQEYLLEVQRAGARASQLVQQILTFSKPEGQQLQPLQMRPVAEEALRLLRATIPAMIEIRTDFAADLPAVAADSTQIHQIIVNLVTNAVHAVGSGGGVIELRLELVQVSAEHAASVSGLTPGKYVRLTVSDNGSGMDRATLARIFDPFFSTKPPGQGTGLGLSVVHGIMKSYRGAVAAQSEPSKGASFHLYFPALESTGVAPPLRAAEVPAGRGERVLYVDDERPLVNVTTRILRRLGYAVSGFTEPTQALKMFCENPRDFDVVVTDLAMPTMSGFDFARELLRVRPDVPILMTSGYVRTEDRATAEAIGVRELIAKPAVLDELGHALARVFGRVAPHQER